MIKRSCRNRQSHSTDTEITRRFGWRLDCLLYFGLPVCTIRTGGPRGRAVKSAAHGRIQREGGEGDRESGPPPPPPPPPGIARLLIFAMLKFSVRPLLGIWTPLEKIFWIRAWRCFLITRSSHLCFLLWVRAPLWPHVRQAKKKIELMIVLFL